MDAVFYRHTNIHTGFTPMLTDAKLRNLKYKAHGRNRHPDRDGLYAQANEGGSVSFRYEYLWPQTPPRKHQIVVYGHYFKTDSDTTADYAMRLAGIEKMLRSIPCASSQESQAIDAVCQAITAAMPIFTVKHIKPIEKNGRTMPLLTLEEARDLHREFRRQLGRGINPMAEAKKAREQATVAATLPSDFRSVGERWYIAKGRGKSDSWKEANRRYLDAAYDYIGSRDVKELAEDTKAISAVLRPAKNAGLMMKAEKLRQCIAMVFDYAAGDPEFLVKAGTNPARALTFELPDTKHHAHLQIKEVPEFLKAVDADRAAEQIKIAARLLFLTLTRKMELIGARWEELDLDNAHWLIPAARMKGGYQHIVPLPRQAVALFRRLKELAGNSEWVFPHKNRKRHMSGDIVNHLYKRVGYLGKATPHGCRSTASSTLNELNYSAEHIEKQLAHNEQDETRAAYLHTDFMPARRRLLQDYADAIDRICAGQPLVIEADNVTSIQSAKAA